MANVLLLLSMLLLVFLWFFLVLRIFYLFNCFWTCVFSLVVWVWISATVTTTTTTIEISLILFLNLDAYTRDARSQTRFNHMGCFDFQFKSRWICRFSALSFPGLFRTSSCTKIHNVVQNVLDWRVSKISSLFYFPLIIRYGKFEQMFRKKIWNAIFGSIKFHTVTI